MPATKSGQFAGCLFLVAGTVLSRAISRRSGDWKLVVAGGGSGSPALYDLAHDIGEQKDLAASHPDRVAELTELYAAWSAKQAPPWTERVRQENRQAR